MLIKKIKSIYIYIYILISILLIIFGASFISSCAKTEGISKKQQHYNIVFTWATVPVSMSALDFWQTPYETYMWYGRKSTFADVAQLKQRVHLVGDAGKKQLQSFGDPECLKQVDAMKQVVKKIYKANANNTFTFYTNIFGSLANTARIFYQNNIPLDNYNVIAIEDGASDANILNSYFDTTSGLQTESDIINKWNTSKNDVNAKLQDNSFDWNTYDSWANFLSGNDYAFMSHNNVKYWHQGRIPIVSQNLIDNVVCQINSKVVRIWANNTQIANGDRGLSNELMNYPQLAQSFKQALFGNELSNIFNGKNNKKPLIFTGTSVGGEISCGFDTTETTNNFTNQNFAHAINKIKEVYGNDYYFIYKGHPSWPTQEGYDGSVGWKNIGETAFNTRVEYINNNFDYSIPEQIPMDMIMVFYDNVALNLGGYQSSLYSVAGSGSIHNVQFIVTSDGTNVPPTEPYGLVGNTNGTMWTNGDFDRDVGGITYRPGLLCPYTYDVFTGRIVV